jgi:hypothetical protein
MYSRFFNEPDTLSTDFLEYLQDGSLTYFHNLSYDSCFFLNCADKYNIKLLERNGKIIKLTLSQFDEKGKAIRVLTFVDSYRIIPAPLRSFAQMFNLSVHKEVMAYKLYTQENRERRCIPITEFYEQYDRENDQLSEDRLRTDHDQILKNADVAKALSVQVVDNEVTNWIIDIMEYAKFYCLMDCVVLMKGLEKFSLDLGQIYKECKTTMPPLSNFVSISAVGYSFAQAYGCFDECFELAGKPQEFILRCVSGGRCMTANNVKQYVEGSIQDFDAVSLYPSAMFIMDGIPKGRPKIISHGADIFQFDTFFVEINITKIKCKSTTDYAFGQVFHKNHNGSKIFDNDPVEHFYIDKRGLLDLLEFYEVEN